MKLLEQLQREGVVSLPPKEGLAFSVDLEQTGQPVLLLSDRRAKLLSEQQSIDLLCSSFLPELDFLLRNHFMANWIVIGAQIIWAKSNVAPQRFHRDHLMPAGNCAVWAFALKEGVLVDTLFCPKTHLRHKMKPSPKMLERYPPLSLNTRGVLYDSTIVHAGQNSAFTRQPSRVFISFVSDILSDKELLTIARFNGIDDPIHIPRKRILKLLQNQEDSSKS